MAGAEIKRRDRIQPIPLASNIGYPFYKSHISMVEVYNLKRLKFKGDIGTISPLFLSKSVGSTYA
jgi:hypothetical protein